MTSRNSIVTLLSVFALIACAKKSDAPADSTGARAMAPTDSALAAAPSAPGGPSTATYSDANIVFILDQANASDSARGALATTKGTSADVKNFGRLMMGEHHALRQQGLTLATKLNVTPAAPSNDMSESDARTAMDKLTAETKGKSFDRAYIEYEVAYHKAVLDIATKALAATHNEELKDLITKAAPVIQKHLDRAVAIQSKLQAM
jgi:putative membrane protein